MKHALIVGGSSGIGKAIAIELALDGYIIMLVGRDEGRLTDTRDEIMSQVSTTVVAYSCNITNEKCLEELANACQSWCRGTLDALIYSAGDIECGEWNKLSLASQKQVMDVNYWGATQTTKACWSSLISARGHVVLLSSVAGYMGLFGYAGYAPSKHALTAWAECLRMEATRDGVVVSVAFPGDTTTPLLAKERASSLPETKAINAGVKERHPKDVAKCIVAGMHRGTFEIYTDSESPWIRRLKALMPRLFYRMLDRMSQKVTI